MTLQNMSLEELKSLNETITVELESRCSARRDELIQAVCDAMNLLHKEFPTVELCAAYRCYECGVDDEFDVMDHFCSCRNMCIEDFYV